MPSSNSSPTRSGSHDGLLDGIFLGSVGWDALCPFPRQETLDQRIGDEVMSEFRALLREHVSPTLIDATRRLPDGLFERLREGGYFKLAADRRLGGRELSRFNVFRVVETAASWSPPIAHLLAFGNGYGAVAYLPILPEGALRDLVTTWVAAGLVGCGADAESAGAANRRRVTVATPANGGYRLHGEKVHISLASVADVMDVSATVTDGSGRIRLFFLDTRASGVQVSAEHEFLGLKGLPVGAVRLDGAYVPQECMIGASDDEWRRSPELAAIGRFGRTLATVAPAVGIGRLCLDWSREFLGRRRIDCRALGEYDEIRRLVATSVAEVFALEAVTRWCLLGTDAQAELSALKNIASVTCWRVIDRTMSLLGAEGLETARSKALRNVPPLPIERFFRDARALRVAGGVDFQVDNWAAQARIASCFGLTPPADAAPALVDDFVYKPIGRVRDADAADLLHLSAANRRHLRFVDAHVSDLGDACRMLVQRHAATLFGRERTLITLNRISSELLTMALVLAYASDRGDEWQQTAEVYCTTAQHRLAALWHQLAADPSRAYHEVCDQWLRTDQLDSLLADALTDLPSALEEEAR